MQRRKPISPALLALTGSALAIPGMARAADVQTDYRYSAYREDDIARDKTSNANRERYDIDTHQFRIAGSPNESLDLSADLSYETMSGASPWFITPDATGRPIQVMSGATIKDDRSDILLNATRRFDWGSGSILAGYSDERDYKAVNVGLEGTYDFDEKLGTFSAGVGYSDDTLDPTDGGSPAFPTRIRHATKDSITAFAGISHVLDADTVVQSSVSYTDNDGYLSDPYKLAFVAATLVQDARPDGRRQFTWLTRLRHFFPKANGSAHADYRYYEDDWDVVAHTVDLSWHQSFSPGWEVVPDVRWYSQSESFFYSPYYTAPRADGFASSDYRLSPYGALSYSLAVNKSFDGNFRLSLRYERYDSDASYAADSVRVENPGLVDFDVISIGLRKVF